jgi:hypothetical protein
LGIGDSMTKTQIIQELQYIIAEMKTNGNDPDSYMGIADYEACLKAVRKADVKKANRLANENGIFDSTY